MSNDGIVQIHGKDYMTVAKRVELAHENGLSNVTTEIVSHDPVVIKATVTTKKGTFTGISSVSLSTGKMIEKSNPYEVAETSAVGRALGFAGFGIVESIASADEMVRATGIKGGTSQIDPNEAFLNEMDQEEPKPRKSICAICGEKAELRSGISSKTGKPYTGTFCSTGDQSHTKWG